MQPQLEILISLENSLGREPVYPVRIAGAALSSPSASPSKSALVHINPSKREQFCKVTGF